MLLIVGSNCKLAQYFARIVVVSLRATLCARKKQCYPSSSSSSHLYSIHLVFCQCCLYRFTGLLNTVEIQSIGDSERASEWEWEERVFAEWATILDSQPNDYNALYLLWQQIQLHGKRIKSRYLARLLVCKSKRWWLNHWPGKPFKFGDFARFWPMIDLKLNDTIANGIVNRVQPSIYL